MVIRSSGFDPIYRSDMCYAGTTLAIHFRMLTPSLESMVTYTPRLWVVQVETTKIPQGRPTVSVYLEGRLFEFR